MTTEFKPFHEIFDVASLFVSIDLEIYEESFQTTAVAEEAGSLRETLVRALFNDIDVTPYNLSVVDAIISSANDPKVWKQNTATEWPMSAKVAYEDDLLSLIVTIYAITDGSRRIETEVTAVAPGATVGENVQRTIVEFIKQATMIDGTVFIGYSDKAGFLPAMASLSRAKDFAVLTVSPIRSERDRYENDPVDPDEMVFIEAAFIQEQFAKHSLEIIKLPTFHKATNTDGMTFVQLTGPRGMVFSGIQPYAHALVGLRPLIVPTKEEENVLSHAAS